MNTRAIAYQMLLHVVQTKTAFQPQLVIPLAPNLSDRDRAFVLHLCFGVLRHYFLLREMLQKWLQQPLKNKDLDIELLLIIGLYQLFFTDMAPYAALNETVNACPKKKSWAKSLCNAILRQAIISPKPELQSPEMLHKTHPAWLVKIMQTHYAEQWPAIIAANQVHPPFTLRINARKITREAYLSLLTKANISAKALIDSPSAIQLDTPIPVEQLPGFDQGLVSVQDISAQLSVALLDVENNMRVLDACAAPGGKAAHLLEMQDVQLLALDSDKERVQLLQNTFTRLQLKARVQHADATQPETWWDQQHFDRILLDAPCSGTGVIRRHPDIKLLRTAEDIEMLASKQSILLAKLWPLLKPGGLLLYATCSILPMENQDRIAHFLKDHPDALHLPIMADWGMAQTWGRQILPGHENRDGFYYARIKKQA